MTHMFFGMIKLDAILSMVVYKLTVPILLIVKNAKQVMIFINNKIKLNVNQNN